MQKNNVRTDTLTHIHTHLSSGLLQRSWLEYEKRRTMDRAMLQVNGIRGIKYGIQNTEYKIRNSNDIIGRAACRR